MYVEWYIILYIIHNVHDCISFLTFYVFSISAALYL